MKAYYTYLHRDTNGRVIYVGCARAYHHKIADKSIYQRAYSLSGHHSSWGNAISDGYTVEILKHFTDRNIAFDEEKRLIAEMRSIGEPLVNICDGGPGMPGAKDSIEVRRKKAVTKIGDLNPMFGKTGSKHPLSRPVIHLGYGVFYESVSEAALVHGYKMQTLWAKLIGKNPNNTMLRLA